MIEISIEDRFQVTISTRIPEQAMFSICGTCGAAVPRRPLSLVGFTIMDCQAIHHEWHRKLERDFNDIPPKNWDLGGR